MSKLKADRRRCMQQVMGDDRLAAAHNQSMSNLRYSYNDDLEAIAGYLHMSGFLDSTALVCAGERNRRKFIASRVDDAVLELRAVGLLPIPGWSTLAWFVFKWVVLPYLQRLLTLWSEDQAETGSVVIVSSEDGR